MSDSTTSDINNLSLHMVKIREIEKNLAAASSKDDATVGEIKRLDLEMKYEMGRFDERFREFIVQQGLPEKVHLLDIIQHFYTKGRKALQ